MSAEHHREVEPVRVKVMERPGPAELVSALGVAVAVLLVAVWGWNQLFRAIGALLF